jgi:hypothetical protein
MDRLFGRTLRRGVAVLGALASIAIGRPAEASEGPPPELLAIAQSASDRVAATRVLGNPDLLTIIDYSLPSTEKRLWVVERTTGAVLWHELVAHGEGTGGDLARHFSNAGGSHQTSLGVFVTADTYHGRNGYSLRLIGLEAGVNDRALERAIVMHGAPYVGEEFIRRAGRLGRSWGCPAVRPAVARSLIDRIKGGSVVFAYYPDASWLAGSAFVSAASASLSPRIAPAG